MDREHLVFSADTDTWMIFHLCAIASIEGEQLIEQAGLLILMSFFFLLIVLSI